MDYFISVITKDSLNNIVESQLLFDQAMLTESSDEYVVGVTSGNENVIRVPIPTGLSKQQSDELAESIAHRLFEAGYDDFDIEISANNDVDFDVVEDIQVFMQNDPVYYRRVYLPAVLRLKDKTKSGKSVDCKSLLGDAVNRAISTYCSQYDVGPAKSVFTPEKRSELLQKVYERELENIRKGEYD